MQPSVRGGPVRPEHRVGQEGNRQLLQLVLYDGHGGDDGVGDDCGVRAVERELVDRARHSDDIHVLVLLDVFSWLEIVCESEARGKPYA